MKITIQSRLRWIIQGATVFLLLLLVFFYGVGVGHYHWTPFPILLDIKTEFNEFSKTDIPVKKYYGEQAILRLAFSDPLIPGQQIYQPITSLEGIQKSNESIMFPYEDFLNAYINIIITKVSYLELNDGRDRILKLNYKHKAIEYVAFAYAPVNEQSHKVAAQIIPGSGGNQSFAIYREDLFKSNYHFGIIEALGNSIDKYILVKPNEDFLAFHDGNNKLKDTFIINWQLDRGSSYSAHYIVNSLAITKYLKGKYDRVVVAGLSQGGEAALLNSLQSQPDIAIIAAGFTVIFEKAEYSGHSQVIIPGLHQQLDFETIRSRIDNSMTNFLFTYGTQEGVFYKFEAEDKLSCNYLANLENVICGIHDGGHEFHIETIKRHLSRFLP